MRACTCPPGPAGPCNRDLCSPTPTAPLRSPTVVDRRGREVDYLDPPYSRPIASFASDRDSLPYCPVIGQSRSTPSFFLASPFSNLSLLASLIYPGPDISNTAGLPLLMRFSGSGRGPPWRMGIYIYIYCIEVCAMYDEMCEIGDLEERRWEGVSMHDISMI